MTDYIITKLFLMLFEGSGQTSDTTNSQTDGHQEAGAGAGAGGYLVWGLARVRARVKPQPRLGNFLSRWFMK